MDFTLTSGQEQALQMVKKLSAQPHDRPRVGVLRGYAGTGKTTLIRVLAQEVGALEIVAPTGKAAVRVTEATGLSAGTIHRLIYKPTKDEFTGEMKFSRKDPDELQHPESGLLVVEESSMVNEQVWDDLYEAARVMGCHILCVGDPFQLPPVEDMKREGVEFGCLLPNFRFDYEATLTEITRQAMDSPIIRASLKMRSGRADEAVMELDRVAPRDVFAEQLRLLQTDGVVICHRNITRHALNTEVRKAKQLPEKTLAEGELLLVLKNNYELNRFNGEVLKFDGWKRTPSRQWQIYDRYKDKEDSASFGLASVEGTEVVLVPKAVMGGLDHLGISAIEQVAKTAIGKEYSYLHANFGYTLTAHKSQGSEWNDVLVIVERSVRPFTRDGMRWMYTAVTRARHHVAICWVAGSTDEQFA